jgi:putative drug exporter of the RND superfamily
MMLYRLGRTCVRRRRLVVLAWIGAAVAVFVVAGAAGGETADDFDIPGVESQQARDVLDERFPEEAGASAQLVFAVGAGTLSDPAPAATIDDALDDVAAQPYVSDVGDLQRAPDDRVAFATVQYTDAAKRDVAFENLEATAEAVNDIGVVQMELGGELAGDMLDQEPEGQEIYGLVAAIIVLLLAFGSVIAMGLPIGTAIVGLATGIGLISIVAAFIEVNTTAPVLAAMIGLGVGIDYSLFIVTRHREHLELGMTVEEAAGRAIATSGAAVVLAGSTVVIAICGLAIANIQAVTVLGLMSALVVIVMVLVALTLLPALLGFAGHKIDAIRIPFIQRRARDLTRETMWHRWGRQVTRHPWRYLIAAVVVLGALAAPVFSLRLGMPDNGSLPESFTTRRAYDLLAEGFGAGFNGPLLLSVELDGAQAADLADLEDALAADPGVSHVAPTEVNEDGSAAVIQLIPTSAPQAAETTQLVHRLRNDVMPESLAGVDATVYVGGQTAVFIDLNDRVSARLPWFIAAVIGLSVLLLMVVFRSIAVPLKAAAMNVLSIAAAYGILVAVFQWGWAKDLFGIEETIPIVSFMPMMLFAILFGLSMDYEVFLLSRVREEYVRTGDNDTAVIEGIASTARVITSAALIMIAVFASFVLGDDINVKLFGVGLAAAVLIDATIVRVVLVPATMKLLGNWNWWLPGWLDRILPNLDVDGGVGLPEPEYEPRRDSGADAERKPALVG